MTASDGVGAMLSRPAGTGPLADWSGASKACFRALPMLSRLVRGPARGPASAGLEILEPAARFTLTKFPLCSLPIAGGFEPEVPVVNLPDGGQRGVERHRPRAAGRFGGQTSRQ